MIRNLKGILTASLILDRVLLRQITSYGANEAYFGAKLVAGDSELEAIKDKTLNPKVITDEEMQV